MSGLGYRLDRAQQPCLLAPASSSRDLGFQYVHIHRLLLFGQASPLHSEDAVIQGIRKWVLQRHFSHQFAVLLGFPQDLEGCG